MKSKRKRVNKNHIQRINIIDTTAECLLINVMDNLLQLAHSLENSIQWYEGIMKKDELIKAKSKYKYNKNT